MKKRIIIDPENPNYDRDEYFMFMFINSVFNMFNDCLNIGLDLTLRDIQKELQAPVTKDSFTCGWIGKINKYIEYEIKSDGFRSIIELDVPIEDVREFL